MQLLLIQYQLDTHLLDQELAILNSQYEQVKTHAQQAGTNQEFKVFLDRLNKSIISKKKAKIAKDRMTFTEGYAYRWDNQIRGRGFGHRNQPQTNYRNVYVSEDDFESDSSFSSSFTGTATTAHNKCILPIT